LRVQQLAQVAQLPEHLTGTSAQQQQEIASPWLPTSTTKRWHVPQLPGRFSQIQDLGKG
jgi:hypothetical protein